MGGLVKQWGKRVSGADSQPFDDVSCLLECLLRDLRPMPTPPHPTPLALWGICIMSSGLEDHMVFREEVRSQAKQLVKRDSKRESDTLLSKCPVGGISRDFS